MALVQKSVVVNYSAEQMFSLVERVEDYPRFLPWCSAARVERDSNGRDLFVTMTISFHGFSHSFTTKNVNTPPKSIEIRLVSGPFSRLEGRWTFTPKGEKSCKAELMLDYEFSNWLLTATLGSVFELVTGSLVSAFSKRAKEVYG